MWVAVCSVYHEHNPSLSVPARYRAQSFSRAHEAFVGCGISSAPAFGSNGTSQRSEDKYCRLPTISRKSQHSCMSRAASGFCLTDPPSLGIGSGLQFVSPMFIPRAHLVHCPDFEPDVLREVRLDLVLCWSRSGAAEILRVCQNEHIQLVVCKELWCCVATVETLLFKAFCHEVYPACSSAAPTTQLSSQSPKDGGRIPQCSLLFQPFGGWVPVTLFFLVHVEERPLEAQAVP